MADRGNRDPVAIVGIGCRFPGDANGPDRFWRLLRDGGDAIREVPADRWSLAAYYDPEPGTPGKTNARRGGFLSSIDRFDAGFFGIAPREAARMDPQQRLLLEVAVEALEDAGFPFERIAGSQGGVYVGISSYDYTGIQQGPGDRLNIDAHSNTGGALSIAANRISYFLDLRGPSMALDTACSSSLVAVHLACQELWGGEGEFALAGGVNVLIKPEPFVGFSRLSMLSPDGRCKAFDAGANGFVRAEGAGFVVLKRLADAERDGDRIYAVVLGTGTNQDGRTSSMTIPSRDAQKALLRATCAQAGVAPHDVSYVEAHGTGTLVGDPIEAAALGAVYGVGRPDGPCTIGSVKTNIGHLEPAAGIAGLIKVALSLRHGMVPGNLHFERPNELIPFDELNVRVPRELEPLPQRSGGVLAGINSFGFGGANAHAIVRQYVGGDRAPADADDAGEPRLVTLSARSAEALKAQAERFRDHLSPEGEGAGLSFGDVAWTTAARRSHFEHRLAVVSRSREEFVERLDGYVEGAASADVAVGRSAAAGAPRLAFVCSGQGPQWWAMGRQLLEHEAVFAAMIERCDAGVRALGPWSLLEELRRDEADSRMQETAIAQPAIFAIQVALAALWRSWGVEPQALVGHSVGEVAAAHLAGVLTLDDAIRVIYHRGRCMDFAAAQGKMLAVGLRADDALELIRGREQSVSLAAINSPSSVTLSGEGAALEPLAEELESRGVFHRFLKVQYAFHSPLMDPMREALLAALDGLETSEATLPIYSTVIGKRADGPEFAAEYWWRNVRQSVRFADAIEGLIEDGFNHFVELAPHPVLGASVLECDTRRSGSLVVVPSLRRGDEERSTMLRSLARLYSVGCPVDWAGLEPQAGRFVALPAYPWQHERYWNESEETRRQRLGTGYHPLLGQRIVAAQATWQNQIDLRVLRYVADHRVQSHALMPGTGFLEMTLAAARELHGDESCTLENVELSRALFLEEGQVHDLQLAIDPEDGSVMIHSRPHESDQPWALHARSTLRATPDAKASSEPPATIRERCPVEVGHEECYERLRQMGLDYGPAFRGVETVWCGPDEALGRVVLPEGLRDTQDAYVFHPAMMDACLHPVLVAISVATGGRSVYLPVGLERFRRLGASRERMWSHVRIRSHSRRAVLADIRLLDDDGRVLIDCREARCQAVDQGAGDGLDELVYEYRWLPAALSTESPAARDAADLPAPSAIREVVHAEALRLEHELGLVERTYRFEQDLDRFCARTLIATYRALGVEFRVGRSFSTDELAASAGIADRFRRLVGHHCVTLVDEGVLRRTDDGWEVTSEPPQTGMAWAYLLENHPAFYAEIALVGRTARELADVLRGERDPLEVIFPGGSLIEAEHLYQDSPTLRYYNLLIRRALRSIVEHLPAGRTLRVLEIGAGTGGLTAHVAPLLPVDRTEYVYTDVSKHFFSRAEEKFRDYPFFEFRNLDIERAPEEQGFVAHEFDLILASEALHATADLRQTLRHVARLLAPSGLLLMTEGARPVRGVDIVFGMTDGWWRFADRALRPGHALMPFARWAELFGELGFDECSNLVGSEDHRYQRHVMLTRGPAEVAADAQADAQPTEPATAPSVEVAGPASVAGAWVVLADEGGLGQRLAEMIRARGEACAVVRRQGVDVESLRAAITGARVDDAAFRGVVYLWGLDAGSDDPAAEPDTEAALATSCLGAIHLVRALAEDYEATPPRLWFVTRNAESVGSKIERVDLAQAPLWGLNRVIVNEVPKLRSTIIDLNAADDVELGSLCDELLADSSEDEIVLRGATRWIHRFVHASEPGANRAWACSSRPAPGSTYRLETSSLGVIDKLSFRRFAGSAPAPGEVTIEVVAAGLNFSDVMKALGLYPGLEDGPIPLGIECSGRIVAVGEGVQGFAVGEDVVAIAPFSFGSHVRTSADLVARKPERLSFEEAATVPVAFLTAAYALEHLGRLARGERVLIHSATGGVGLAAIQIARQAGAEVFATAGTPAKRALLREMGIECVMDSRSVEFADEILEATAGEGVDVVLNSLAGEAITKGLEVLRDDGRFLEIGKRDIYANRRVGLRPFRKNLSFMGIDLDREMRLRPKPMSELFVRLVRRFDDGELRPLVHRVFSASNVSGAFRTMSRARHVGKIVLSMQDDAVSVAPAIPDAASFRDDATYLLTGGLGGFGLTVAQWLVECGARHLTLVGRSGARRPEAAAAVASLRESGAEVLVVEADVSRADDVTRMLAEVDATGRPLGGVMHAAMVLDDCLLLKMTERHLRDVWGPKVDGAWLLDRATRGRDLDFFVLFSSISGVFGTGGQANYTSANAFLDALAYRRRAEGLPGLSVSWGYLGEVGFVARHGAIAERFEAVGVRSFTPEQATTLLGRFLQQDPVHAGVMRVDWNRWRKTAAAVSVSPRFAHLVRDGEEETDDGPRAGTSAVRRALVDATPAKRRELIEPLLRQQVAKVLGSSPAKLDPEKSLSDLGLDSLMAVELKNWIEGELGVSLPSVELLRGPSLADLTGVLVDQFGKQDGETTPEPARTIQASSKRVEREEAEQMLARVDEMSDEEVEAALARVRPEAEEATG